MPATIAVDKWLDFIGSEYLGRFVRDGGAAVRFVVAPNQEVKTKFTETLRQGPCTRRSSTRISQKSERH